MNSNQIVDLIVLAVLLYCAVRGAARGLLSQLAWVVALILCFRFSGALAPAIEPLIAVDPPLKQWIAMLAVYVGLCGVSFVAAGMLSSWMEKLRVKDFDRHLGALLGFVKGVIICMTGLYFLITLSPNTRPIVAKTYSGYAAAHILDKSNYLIRLVPEDRQADVQEVIDRFNQQLLEGTDDFNGATPTGPGWSGSLGEGDETSTFDLTDFLPAARDPNSSRDSRGTVDDSSLQDLLGQLPSQLRQELTQKALDTLRQSSPADRRTLQNELSSSVPDDARSILGEFLRNQSTTVGQGTGSGAGSGPPVSSSSTELGRTETKLLNEIAGIYSSRSDVVARAKQYLAGVPASVQRRVLDDWHADAMGLNSDPDPVTDVNTSLDERIVRQLEKSGITLNRLDRDLRNRLSQLLN